MTTYQTGIVNWAGALVLVPMSVFVQGAPERQAMYEIALDIDRDGRMDRAVLVLVGGSGSVDFGPGNTDPYIAERYGLGADESVDLYIYLSVAGEKPDLLRPPDFLKKNIVNVERTNWVLPLESDDRESLIVAAVYGLGASKSIGEGITIIHRDGEFLVAGYAMDWEWSYEVHKSDAEWDVETSIGSCDIDFLTGKGIVTLEPDGSKPIEHTFGPVKLADWSDEKRPKMCDDAMTRDLERE